MICFKESLSSPFSGSIWNNESTNTFCKHLLRKLEEGLILEKYSSKPTYQTWPKGFIFWVLVFFLLKARFPVPEVHWTFLRKIRTQNFREIPERSFKQTPLPALDGAHLRQAEVSLTPWETTGGYAFCWAASDSLISLTVILSEIYEGHKVELVKRTTCQRARFGLRDRHVPPALPPRTAGFRSCFLLHEASHGATASLQPGTHGPGPTPAPPSAGDAFHCPHIVLRVGTALTHTTYTIYTTHTPHTHTAIPHTWRLRCSTYKTTFLTFRLSHPVMCQSSYSPAQLYFPVFNKTAPCQPWPLGTVPLAGPRAGSWVESSKLRRPGFCWDCWEKSTLPFSAGFEVVRHNLGVAGSDLPPLGNVCWRAEPTQRRSGLWPGAQAWVPSRALPALPTYDSEAPRSLKSVSVGFSVTCNLKSPE